MLSCHLSCKVPGFQFPIPGWKSLTGNWKL
jgi:hypothetical protein